METWAKGERGSEPRKGVCMPKAARRQVDSPGMTRLVMIPTHTTYTFREAAHLL